MKMTLEVSGVLELKPSDINKLQEFNRKKILGLLAKETGVVVRAIKDEIKLNRKGGRRYGKHQASPAGVPPNELTGNLRRGITYNKKGKNRNLHNI